MTTTSAKRAGVGGRSAHWTRANVIAAIRRWVECYGEPPRAADWNPSSAKWSAASWRIERYRLGDPDTGAPWPSLNAAKRPFDGSLTAAIVAAGYAPNKPGPRSRKDVRPEVVEAQATPEVRAALAAARAEMRDLAEKIELAERRLVAALTARDRALTARDAARRAARARRALARERTKTLTVVKADPKALREAQRAARAQMRAELSGLRLELASARRDSTRDASRLERAEATVSDLRADRRELRSELERAQDRAASLETRKARMAPTAQPDVHVREVVRVEREVVELPAPEAAVVEAALRRSGEAERVVADAELRVASAERRYREIAEAATGEARMLTPAEMTALRADGPSGEAVLGVALRELAKARRKGGRDPLKAALWSIASAAIRWKDRL